MKKKREWNAVVESLKYTDNIIHEFGKYNNEKIHAAFLRALDAYKVEKYDGKVQLLRPSQEYSYLVTRGRYLNEGMGLVRGDNGWKYYASNLTIIEAPGDHDSMVLSPYVNILSDKIRKIIGLAC